MADLHLEASDTTPEITLDGEQGFLEVRGESYPENALELYQPVVRKVAEILGGDCAAFGIRVDLAYLNTSSVKALMDILDLAEESRKRGTAVEVEWVYDRENDRSREMAEELREDIDLPFRLTPVTR